MDIRKSSFYRTLFLGYTLVTFWGVYIYILLLVYMGFSHFVSNFCVLPYNVVPSSSAQLSIAHITPDVMYIVHSLLSQTYVWPNFFPIHVVTLNSPWLLSFCGNSLASGVFVASSQALSSKMVGGESLATSAGKAVDFRCFIIHVMNVGHSIDSPASS